MKSLATMLLMVVPLIHGLVACAAQPSVAPSVTHPPSDSKCIPPSTNFAFKASSDGIGHYPEENILPPFPWTKEAEIPYGNNLLAVRTVDNNVKELWIGPLPSQLDSPTHRELIVYRTDSWESRNVSLENGLDNFQPILDLYVSSKGQVWAFNNAGQRKSMVPTVLSKYDEASSGFRAVAEVKEIPNGTLVNNQLRYGNQVLLDKNDTFWILVPFDFVYSFQPDSGEVRRYASLEGIRPYDAALAPDGTIYILDKAGADDQLFRFDPDKDELERISYSLEPWPPIQSLLVDHSGRLWAGGLGWMNTDGSWYQIIRSPLFITTKLDLEGGPVYRWQQPQILLESSDQILWFVAQNGMFSLDSQKGEWCWFSTFWSNIVEDSDHNLWTLADGKIYRLSLDK
jgi:hypothetical protein